MGADIPGCWLKGKGDPDPHLTTTTSGTNGERGRRSLGLPGGGSWGGGDHYVTQSRSHRSPWWQGTSLRCIVCEQLALCPPGLPLSMWESAQQAPGLGLFLQQASVSL